MCKRRRERSRAKVSSAGISARVSVTLRRSYSDSLCDLQMRGYCIYQPPVQRLRLLVQLHDCAGFLRANDVQLDHCGRRNYLLVNLRLALWPRSQIGTVQFSQCCRLRYRVSH